MDTPFLIQKAFGKMVDMMDSLSHTMYFHNRRHTENVLITATEMALKSSMPHDDLIILQLAAIFHDTGHLYEYLGHEEKSKLIAASFLLSENVPAGVIESVTSAINATKMPQKPGNELEKIICDADLFHLAKPNYIDYANALRCEWEIYLNKKVSDQEWHQENLDFLTAHRYHSVYGHLVLEPLKEANIAYLKKQAADW